MNIIVERQPNCQALLKVEVPSDAVLQERQQLVKAFSQQARIPGFRPGKAPAAVIQKKYGKEIAAETEERLIGQAYREAVAQEKLRVLNVRDVREQTFHSDESFSFEAELTLAPEIILPEYKGIPVEKPKVEVTEAQVEKTIEGMRQRFANYEDLERSLAMDDFATVDFQGKIEGAPVKEGFPDLPDYLDHAEDFWVRMDEESFLPGFAKGLEGASAGETLSVSVTLADDFYLEALQGKTIDYEVTIKSVKAQRLPEVDDAFAGQLREGLTLEALRSDVREQLEAEATRKADQAVENQIMAYLDSKVAAELPEDIVASETQAQVNEMVNYGLEQGFQNEQIQKQEEDIVNTASERARTSVKTNFILQRILQEEKIEASEAELKQRIMLMALKEQSTPDKLMKQLEKEDRIGSVRHQIALGKVVDFLKENASVTEVEPDSAPD